MRQEDGLIKMSNKGTVCAAVTPDRYELIMCLADSWYKLARQMGVSTTSVYDRVRGDSVNDLESIAALTNKGGRLPWFFCRTIDIGKDDEEA